MFIDRLEKEILNTDFANCTKSILLGLKRMKRGIVFCSSMEIFIGFTCSHSRTMAFLDRFIDELFCIVVYASLPIELPNQYHISVTGVLFN